MKNFIIKLLVCCFIITFALFIVSCSKNTNSNFSESAAESNIESEKESDIESEEENEESKLRFQKIDGKEEYMVTGIGIEESLDIVIPSTYKGLPVTEICAFAFDSYICGYITSVVIPDSVTTIGAYAFCECYGLKSVVIGDSVTTIGDYAFACCTSLTSVVIGKNVISIMEGAFFACSSLTSVKIPNNVKNIGYTTFALCVSLTSIEIGNSVESIEDVAFFGCRKLVEVINNSPHITVAKSVSNGFIGGYALSISNCDSTYISKITNDNSYIVYNDGDEKILLGYDGDEAELVIPNYITKISKFVFSKNLKSDGINLNKEIIVLYNLKSVILPDSVTTISDSAFEGCTSLTSVVIPDSVTTIGDRAFLECSSLTSVYYKGTASDWAKILVESSNYYLTNATRYYYIENEEDLPSDGGNYWHYDQNGKIVVW